LPRSRTLSVAPRDPKRDFAVEVVRRLREAGYVAYWAGGCVRDQLLGRPSKDYDVATNATPDQVRRVFGRRRTQAVGAAFGVITVAGPPGAGQVEVATFRSDQSYSDGRRPDAVVFSTPEEDAARRDFTINGLFYDPLEDRVIDYVGGREDLRRRVLRAIGDPRARLAEDKLRMLRAVRFAARFDLTIAPETLQAIREMAPQITAVSAERIAAEMQALLVDRRRAQGVRLLLETGLASAVLPEIVPADLRGQVAGDGYPVLTPDTRHPTPALLEESLAVLERLEEPSFALALAALVCRFVDCRGVRAIGRRWRLALRDTQRAAWLVQHRPMLESARRLPWSKVQPVVAHPASRELLELGEAEVRAGLRHPDDTAWWRNQLALPAEVLNPPPLITGEDLKRLGLRPGPLFRPLLDRVRAAQLDGQVRTPDEALNLAQQHAQRLIHDDKGDAVMDKKTKKRIEAVQQRIQRLRQQLAGAKHQADDAAEAAHIARQLAEAEAELAKLKGKKEAPP